MIVVELKISAYLATRSKAVLGEHLLHHSEIEHLIESNTELDLFLIFRYLLGTFIYTSSSIAAPRLKYLANKIVDH